MTRRMLAVLHARNLEFLRDRAAMSWNFIFPLLIVAGFAFAFSGEPMALYKVGVSPAPPKAESGFFATRHIQFIAFDDLSKAITKVERHQIDMLFDGKGKRYWINEESQKGYMLERILRGSSDGADYTRQAVSGREVGYVDWVIPGVLGMNVMFSALFGIGFVIVRYRKNGVLKRLRATPLTAVEFLTAQVTSRLMLILLVNVLVFLCIRLFVDFSMHGSYLLLLLVLVLGATSMISMGLIIAARSASEELAGGLLNLMSWPMMFLSGVWFSLEGLHPLLKQVAQWFPLTHLIDAARAVMIDGAGLADISWHLLVMALMSVVCLSISAVLFRWE